MNGLKSQKRGLFIAIVSILLGQFFDLKMQENRNLVIKLTEMFIYLIGHLYKEKFRFPIGKEYVLKRGM